MKKCIKEWIRYIFMFFFYHIRNRKKKRVFFISFSGKQYSDSPKVISEKLHEIAPDVEIIWLGNEKVKHVVPSYVKCVSVSSLKSIKYMAQANVWVANSLLSNGMYKGRKTLYIQTFHGDRGFKKCGYDATFDMGEIYQKYNRRYFEEKKCDYYLTGSIFAEHFAKVAYGINCPFLKHGIPRNDILVNFSQLLPQIRSIKVNLKIEPEKKILLYAPTFRDYSRDVQNVSVDLTECLDVLCQNGEDWICLMRAHSATSNLLLQRKDNRVKNVSDYMDMADLLLIADCLITDYSSSAGDFVLTNRPIVLTHFDINEYTSNSRTLCFDPKEPGYLIAYNQNELNHILSQLSEYDHNAISEKVNSFYGTYESGKSADYVCEIIQKWL